MVLPIAEFTVAYQDVYTLDLPFAPPAEAWRSFNSQQQTELARLMNAPKAMHKARLTNKSQYPLTTAPALILREGRVVAQGMMTYTAPGASTDVSLTTAIDIQVKKTDNETKRTPNGFHHNGNNFMQVDLSGSLLLVNHRAQAVKLEVTRYVLGRVDSASQDGKIQNANTLESADYLPSEGEGMHPYWWGWYGWPWWWSHVNGVGKISWKVSLEPGHSLDLEYAWHYYWQ
jgi:hypothetical protein